LADGDQPPGFAAGGLRGLDLAALLGVVVGDDFEAAERRFFDAWAAGGVPRAAPPPAAGPAAPVPSGPIIGLFPEPGARA